MVRASRERDGGPPTADRGFCSPSDGLPSSVLALLRAHRATWVNQSIPTGVRSLLEALWTNHVNALIAMPAVDLRITIDREKLGCLVLLGHAHKAGVGQVHRHVRIFPHERQHFRRVTVQRIGNLQNTYSQHIERQVRAAWPGASQMRYFGKDGFARNERGELLELLTRSIVVLIVGIEIVVKKARIGNGKHAHDKELWPRSSRYALLVETSCKPLPPLIRC